MCCSACSLFLSLCECYPFPLSFYNFLQISSLRLSANTEQVCSSSDACSAVMGGGVSGEIPEKVRRQKNLVREALGAILRLSPSTAYGFYTQFHTLTLCLFVYGKIK